MPMLTSDCKSWLPKLSFLASFSVLQLVRARIEEGRGWKRVQGIQCAHPCRNTSWVAFSSLSCFLCACACLCGRVSVIMYEEFADLYTVYFSPNATLAVVGLVWSCRLMDGKVADEIVHLSEGQWWRTARLERGCLSHLVGFFFFFFPPSKSWSDSARGSPLNPGQVYPPPTVRHIFRQSRELGSLLAQDANSTSIYVHA